MKRTSVTLLAGAFLSANPAVAMDIETYKDVANATIKSIKRGKVRNIDKLIDRQKRLIRLAIEGALIYADANPADAKMIHLTVLNSHRMQRMSLEEIEREWHAGGYLRTHGIDMDQFTEMDVQKSYLDTIVHPATAIIALKQYKKSKDPALLEQVQDELTEVVQHVDQLR